jgi:UDP-N-acetylmuramate dehydrogenase
MQQRAGVPIAPMTTLGLGGRAARFVEAASERDVELAVKDAAARSEPLFVLGGGSNVVVGDDGFAGLVVRMASRGVDVAREGDRVVVDVAAGEEWDALVARSAAEEWSGIEAMSGIPGLVGATPMQNVGAYGQEVADTIVRVRAFDRHAGAFVDIASADCGFSYRTSKLKTSDRWIVVRVVFALRASGDGAAVRYAELARALGVREGDAAPTSTIRDTVLRLRRAKGMVVDGNDPESASAGSFFVNPVVDDDGLRDVEKRARDAGLIGDGETMPRFAMADGRWKLSAGWMIERAGFPKGFGDGAVGVSKKHALALVHRGGGSTRELLDLARTSRDALQARFGIVVVPEPVLVGCSL